MVTLQSIQAKIAKLQAQAQAIAEKQSATIIAKIRDLMDRHGLSLADIDAHTRGRKRGPKGKGAASQAGSAKPAKYRDPKTGATWTGHGRAPGWIANAKDRSKFLIDGNAPAVTSVAKKAAPAGNYRRGPQPAKYRDPKSGATWSGRGPAPAWLAKVKDRTAFLIDGAGKASAAPATAAVKKTAVKKTAKPAAKKVAVKKAAAENAPVAVAPVKTPAAKKAVTAKKTAVKRTPAKPAANGKGAAKKVAAKQPAAEKAVVAAPVSTGNEVAAVAQTPAQ